MNKEVVEQQQVQELLLPRYKVIADFPGNPYVLGAIIKLKSEEDARIRGSLGYLHWDFNIKMYPHLFRLLQWWEDRTEEEMPRYVKLKHGKVYKVKRYTLGKYWYARLFGHEASIPVQSVIPATEAEFLHQQNLNNG
jgi:hypothetical protein